MTTAYKSDEVSTIWTTANGESALRDMGYTIPTGNGAIYFDGDTVGNIDGFSGIHTHSKQMVIDAQSINGLTVWNPRNAQN